MPSLPLVSWDPHTRQILIPGTVRQTRGFYLWL